MIILHDKNGKELKLETFQLTAVMRKGKPSDPTRALIKGMGIVEVKEDSEEIIKKLEAEAVTLQ
jgi:hypothetical protein